MHHIHPHKITHVEDGTHDYLFQCYQPDSLFSEVSHCVYLDTLGPKNNQQEMLDISEVQREIYMWELFEIQIIPRIVSGEILHLNGTFTKKIYDYIRDIYRTSGYFCDSENRFRIPDTAQITLGITLTNLNYSPREKSSIYLSQ